jgi:MFS family permease
MKTNHNSHLALIALSLGAKLLVDTSQQIFQPFLPIIAKGVDLEILQLSRLVALASLMGLSAPLMGHLADIAGYRSVLRVSLYITGASLLSMVIFPVPWMIVASMVFIGLGSAGYSPILQAYLSTKLPYENRGRGLASVEFSWALAGIFGLYIAGNLIEISSWKTPFYSLGFGLIVFFLLFSVLPGKEQQESIVVASVPFLQTGVIPAVISLILVRACFEVAYVSTIPLLSEQTPSQRGKIMGLSIAFGNTGAAIGQIVGPAVYFQSGILPLAGVSLSAILIALPLLIFVVKDSAVSSQNFPAPVDSVY